MRAGTLALAERVRSSLLTLGPLTARELSIATGLSPRRTLGLLTALERRKGWPDAEAKLMRDSSSKPHRWGLVPRARRSARPPAGAAPSK